MKCAVYIRVSTDKEEQKTSLENQQRFFYNVMAEKGWELFQFYVDVESGTSSKKRAMLLKLIEDAKQKKFDVILSKELSRLARNGKLSYEIKEVAENNRIHIITFDNAINSIENNSNMFGLYAWIYEQESQRTSERIKIAFNTKARRGEFNGSVPPYGYTLNNKQLFISDNVTPDVVRYIFNKYINGVGYDAIARSLSKKGIPTPSTIANKSNKSKYWIGTSIKKILTNPHYVGDLVQRREETVSVTSVKRRQIQLSEQIIIPNTHDAIISRDEFDLVQQLIHQRRQKNPKSSPHLFTNFLFCADCHSGLWYRSNRKGYICGSYSRHGNIACSKHLVSEQFISNYILDLLNTAALRFQQNKSSDFFEKEAIKQSKVIQEDLEKTTDRLVQIKNKRRKYLDLLSEDVITHHEYRDAIECLSDEEKELNIKRSELNRSLQLTLVNSKLNAHLQQQLQDTPFEKVTKQLLATFIKRIDVSEDGQFKVQYHSPFLAALVSPV